MAELEYADVLASKVPPAVNAERATALSDKGFSSSTFEVQRITHGENTLSVPIGQINHAALGRPVDKQYERNLESVKGRIRAYGVTTATVINFLPIPLVSDSHLAVLKYPGLKIPAPKDGQNYTTHHFDECYFEPTRIGVDSPNIPIDQHPIVLAQEFSKINNFGVMTFLGIPADIEDPEWRNKRSTEEQHHGMTYGQFFEKTRTEAVDWMMKKVEEGDDLDRLEQATTFPQKQAARRLHWLGIIKELPKWVKKAQNLKVELPVCPNCQTRGSAGAPSCITPGCGYILDPRRAYEIGAISESHESLERLTRAVVKDMGISAYVAETVDEKKVRLEQGGMKPLSEVALRMMDAQDDQNKMRQVELVEALKQANQTKQPKAKGGE